MFEKIPFAAMILSFIIMSFLVGMYVTHERIFPYQELRSAKQTFEALIGTTDGQEQYRTRLARTDLAASDAGSARWRVIDPSFTRIPVLVYGGFPGQFLELCPVRGCLAVVFGEDGNVTQYWPFEPAEILAHDITAQRYPYEKALGFDPATDFYPSSIEPYDNGDLLVVFQARIGKVFPFGMGVARIANNGDVRWMRSDYSHHWSMLAPNETAFVPSLRIGRASLEFTLGAVRPRPKRISLPCATGKPQLDTIKVIDGDGALIDEIDLVQIILDSHWASIIGETIDPCDPLHLNFVDQVGSDAGTGLAEGDLVVSLRNVSRFAILSKESRTIKRVVSGSFIQQHAVQHLDGTRFIVFDNWGGDELGPGSRVIEIDIGTGEERRIFPNNETPAEYQELFTGVAGHLALSSDKSRAIASFTMEGKAFEIDISSGRIIAVYDHLQDESQMPNLTDEDRAFAFRHALQGTSYVNW